MTTNTLRPTVAYIASCPLCGYTWGSLSFPHAGQAARLTEIHVRYEHADQLTKEA